VTQEENAPNPEEPEEITHFGDKTEGEGAMTPLQRERESKLKARQWLTLIQNASHLNKDGDTHE